MLTGVGQIRRMQIVKRTMNWLPRASAYDEAVARQKKSKELSEAFIATSSALAQSFDTMRNDEVAGMGEIISNIAAKRLNIAI